MSGESGREKVKSGSKSRRPAESIVKSGKKSDGIEERVAVESTRLEDLCGSLFGLEPRTRLQNSSTMDSGVEDCCESNQALLLPPSPLPFDMEEAGGRRIALRMAKGDEAGFGFSVVWVSPPR
jgi:hypothetical protein